MIQDNFREQISEDVIPYAYMRRSTTKDEQADSLLQQQEGIKQLAEHLGINMEKIRFFTESRSGFENRKRTQWNLMLQEINALKSKKQSCILLCRDSSRLSRNPTDNIAIADRLFGDNEFRKQPVIQAIYMLGGNAELKRWNRLSDKKMVMDELHDNYTNSLETKRKSGTGVLLKLSGGEFPYSAPYGLDRVGARDGQPINHRKGIATVLRQNIKMPYVQKIFQMKVDGKSLKEISAYLKRYAPFSLSPKRINETIIENSVYIGRYTDTNTGKTFENLKFWEGLPPISQDLWERANGTIGKRPSGYGVGQDEHLLVGKIKTDTGEVFSLYKASGRSGTGKHLNYKGSVQQKDNKQKHIYISENNILQFAASEINKIAQTIMSKINIVEDDIREDMKKLFIDYLINHSGFSLENEEIDQKAEALLKLFEDYEMKQMMNATSDNTRFLDREIDFSDDRMIGFIDNPISTYSTSEKTLAELRLTDEIVTQIEDNQFFHTKELQEVMGMKIDLRNEIITQAIKDSDFFLNLESELNLQKQSVEQLLKQKQDTEKELAGVYEKAFELGYDKVMADRSAEKLKSKIQDFDETISKLSNNTNLQDVLTKLPSILAKIVELNCNPHQKAKIKDYRDQIKQVLEIITVELIINDKKELRIKLFEGLEDLLNDENGEWSRGRELNP